MVGDASFFDQGVRAENVSPKVTTAIMVSPRSALGVTGCWELISCDAACLLGVTPFIFDAFGGREWPEGWKPDEVSVACCAVSCYPSWDCECAFLCRGLQYCCALSSMLSYVFEVFLVSGPVA